MAGDKVIEQFKPESEEPKLYGRRWFVLFLYMVVCPWSSFQWLQYAVVSDVVVDYYNVSYEAVNWTNLISLILQVVVSFPACYILDKYGNRVGAIISGVGICLVTWIKVATVSPNRFWLVIVVQGVLTAFQGCFLIMPPKIAETWFGPNEVSVACSIGFTGMQVGVALGFILPPFLIKKETAENDLFVTNIGLAVICTIGAILLILFFTDKPPIPPSYASMNQDHKVQYIKTIKQLIKNKSFIIIFLACGLNIGLNITIQTVLNQIILSFYPDGAKDVGIMGLLMIITGICGSICAGLLIDKFQLYRLSALFYISVVIIATLLFIYTLNLNIIYSYIYSSMLGFFALAFWMVCFQMAIETAYPLSETVIVGIIYAFGSGITIPLTYIYSYLFYDVNHIWANSFSSFVCIISFVLLALVQYDLKRTEVNRTKKLVV